MAKTKASMTASERVHVGTFPTGISYADRTVEAAGDYKRLAFLPFDTLALEWIAKRVSPDVRGYIERDAEKLRAKRGQSYQVSSAGQTVALGGSGGKSKAQLEAEIKKVVGGGAGQAGAGRRVAYRLQLTPGEVKALEFARGRYSWPDMLIAHVSEGGLVSFSESEMWQWVDDVDSDDSPFSLASASLVDKLQSFRDSVV